MSKFRYAAPLAVLAMFLPAAAPDKTAPVCDTDADVLFAGESASYDALAPAMIDPSGEGAAGGANMADIATVAGTAGKPAVKVTHTAVMTWDVPGDYELRAFDAKGEEVSNSTAFNPTDGNIETVTITVDFCAEITYVIDNYLGTPGGPVSLEVSVEGKMPPKKR